MPGPVRPPFVPSPSPIAGRNTSGATVSTTPTQQMYSGAPPTQGTVFGQKPAPAPKSPPSKGTDVSGMQKFLVGKGYNITVDGINGPQTQAAAADFRGSRNPTAFNTGHGLITSPSPAQTDNSNSGATPPTPKQKPLPNGKTQTSDHRFLNSGTSTTTSTQQTDTAAAKAQIAAILAPVIQQIRQAEESRSTAGQAAITGYTTAEQNALKGIDFQQPYTEAGQGQNAINTALLNELQGQGSGLQNELGGELAQAGLSPDQTAALTGRVASDTAGASGANLAKGDAVLSSLLAQGAGAKDYGNKLPGIEALAGAQDTGKLQGAVTSDLNQQLSGVESKVPGMVQSELSSLAANRTAQQKNQIASILAGGYDPTTGQLTPKARAALAGALGYDPVTGKPTAKTVAAGTKAGAINPGVSKILGYAASADGTPITTAGGKIIPVSKTGTQGTPKAPTAKDINTLVGQWKNGTTKNVTTIAKDAKGNPIPNSAGAPETTTQTVQSGQLDYGQAYTRLKTMFMASGMSAANADAQSRQYLDTAYKRGEQGRAWVTNEEQAALTKAGLPPKAAVINGHGVLTPSQYKALKTANRLPPGTLTAEGAYVITQGY